MTSGDFGTLQIGLINFFAPIYVLFKEILAYLVNENGGLQWYPDGSGQLYVTGNLPSITAKGNDILAAVMTIVHNGLVFAAQFTTLLPANALTATPAG